MLKYFLPVVILLRGAIPAFSQTSTGTQPSFEVASIKPAPPGARMAFAIQPGGRLVVNGASLRTLTGLAWHLANYQLAGADGWLADSQWSIEAKPDDALSVPAWTPPNVPEVISARLRALLEDRFQLKTHHETKNMLAYVLTVGKNGSRLSPVDASQQTAPGFRMGPGAIIGSSATMGQFVVLLNRIMGRPVIDKTGVTNQFDMNLHFAPESTPTAQAAPPTDRSPTEEPSIFTAVQEQLGLRLDAVQEPIDVLVIDSARKPSDN